MKKRIIRWNEGKNDKLKNDNTRNNIGFEDILEAIENGGLLDNIKHPDQQKFPNQSILIVEIDNYAYMIPYVVSDDDFFLKTIIPSRKMTNKYLKA